MREYHNKFNHSLNLILFNNKREQNIEGEELVDKKINVFLKPITDFSLSVRTLNCLKYLNIKTLEDLVKENEKSLLQVPKFGRKSLNEIKDLLFNISSIENLEIHLGMSDDSELQDNKKRIEATHNLNLEKYLIPINKFYFSVRTWNCLKYLKIICIGDLVSLTEREFLRVPNFGKKSLTEINNILVELSLTLGMEMPNWPPENYEILVNKNKKLTTNKFDYETINAIFNDLIEREKIIYEKRILQNKTLEFIGKELRITRERVRQIEAKFFRKIKRFNTDFKKFLHSERDYIFDLFSNNSNMITQSSYKSFHNKKTELMTSKDKLIKVCIRSAFNNYIDFFNNEFFSKSKNKFIKRKTANRSRIEIVQVWQKNSTNRPNIINKINSGIFKLYE